MNATTNTPNLVGISIATGSVVSAVTLAFSESSFVGVGQNIAWEPDTGGIIVSGQNAAGDHLFVSGWVPALSLPPQCLCYPRTL